jgi:hydroxymethylbilane synthase
VPLAAYAQVNAQHLSLRALVATPDGMTLYRAQAEGELDQAQVLGQQVAQALIAQGADRILAQLSVQTDAN